MEKILIIGICGAGKSTLANELNRKIGIPVIHLDQHFWKPGWVESEKRKWSEKVLELTSQSKWIMEGNYSSSFNLRFPEADTLIVLDYNPLLAMYRATKRIISFYGKTRPDLSSNCPERFNWEFYKFIWNFNKNHKPRTDEAIRKYGQHLKIYRFKNPRETSLFLQKL